MYTSALVYVFFLEIFTNFTIWQSVKYAFLIYAQTNVPYVYYIFLFFCKVIQTTHTNVYVISFSTTEPILYMYIVPTLIYVSVRQRN